LLYCGYFLFWGGLYWQFVAIFGASAPERRLCFLSVLRGQGCFIEGDRIKKNEFMRIVIQRVSSASVTIGGNVKSAIEEGLLILLGIEDADTNEDIDWLVKKICQLRIFDDENGIMNKSIGEIGGNVLVVSQFTLHASTKKGNRPSYIRASKPGFAIPMYEKFLQVMEDKLGRAIGSGEFGADMKVRLVNDGPVTIIIDSQNKDF
jgi:D-tyrosyl-tRNA(Tyr) deacylase